MDYMDFRRRLVKDAAFRAKFDNCETLDALIEAAAREGYVFAAEEVRNNTKLLPEELATAAGGGNFGLNAANAFSTGPFIINH